MDHRCFLLQNTVMAVVVVTGADNGIGLSLARALAERDFRVAGLNPTTKRLELLEESHPGRVLAYRCDVTAPDQIERCLTEVVEWLAVGRGIARRVGSGKRLITPDLETRLRLFLSRHFPEPLGQMMSRMTMRAHRESKGA